MSTITHANDHFTFEGEVLNSPVPVIVDFWASWCGPCKVVAPQLEDIARRFDGRLRVVKVDVDQNRQTSEEYGIQSIPTIALFRNGRWVSSTVGAKSAQQIEHDLGIDHGDQ